MDPDQTASRGLEEQSELGSHCLQKWLLKSQADDKADDNCCDWQFKGSYFTLFVCHPFVGFISGSLYFSNFFHTYVWATFSQYIFIKAVGLSLILKTADTFNLSFESSLILNKGCRTYFGLNILYTSNTWINAQMCIYMPTCEINKTYTHIDTC